MTSNPSEEQLELVSGRIVDIAQALYPYVALEAESYFDEAGFDANMSEVLQKRLLEYCQNGVELVLEDHPQPRRLARYLLENVEYDVLEAPLDPKLLAEAPDIAAPKAGGGLARHYLLAGGIVFLVVCLFLFLVLGAGSHSSPVAGLDEGTHQAAKHVAQQHARKRIGKRNGSEGA